MSTSTSTTPTGSSLGLLTFTEEPQALLSPLVVGGTPPGSSTKPSPGREISRSQTYPAVYTIPEEREHKVYPRTPNLYDRARSRDRELDRERERERERDRVGQSKTAALIEMYQEKEKQKQSSLNEPSASAKPSRLPVRSTSAPGVPASTAVTATAPVLAPVPSRSRSNPQAEDDDDDEIGGGRASPDDDSVAQHQTPFTISELGRASPMRYVHGAPLHNVLEEEEE